MHCDTLHTSKDFPNTLKLLHGFYTGNREEGEDVENNQSMPPRYAFYLQLILEIGTIENGLQ